ncbi:hypothetical protein F5Y16DRAFT_370205 [Xylariaceae sp. FL0255]|nr:hypothetical protein F5Y16DRAFT_370205 [Xylariaceae sp. FL0255]
MQHWPSNTAVVGKVTMPRLPRTRLKSSEIEFGELLIHLPEHRVVICKQCQFAIQPSAFSSHLQNHHILRSERRFLLNQLSLLHLPIPDDVGAPTSNSPRIAALPVLAGYKCEASIRSPCNYACTSVKRMCQHWSEIHNEPDSKVIKYRKAKLQTFFRGNKIRYFEVEGPKDAQSWTLKEKRSTNGQPLDESHDGGQIETPPLDSRALLYMHNYVRNLRAGLNRDETTEFWMDTIVFEAYKHSFLMYGLLCISAVDMARRETNLKERRDHLQASAAYCAGAISGHRAAVLCPTRENSTALIACSRLVGQHEVVRDLIRLEENDHNFTVEDIIEHLVLLRGCTDLIIQLQPTLPPDSPFRLPDTVKADLRILDGDDGDNKVSSQGRVPPDVWFILTTLEDRLHDAGLLPEDEVPMIQRAIRSLTTVTVYAYNSKNSYSWAAWWTAIEAWNRSPIVTNHLIPAMRERRPAALVLFLSWVLLLLAKVEKIYVWMSGLPDWFVHVAISAAHTYKVGQLVKAIFNLEISS